MTSSPRLPAGLRLREASEDDVPQAAALLASRGEPADAKDLELVAASRGPDAIGVVVDGDRVVSTATLLDETLHLAGVPIPAGQVELVATDTPYEGRGLVRALMDWAHDRSREQGHLAQVMIGIPYFYRQFGYEYVQPMPRWRRLARTPAAIAQVDVRRAVADDLPWLYELQEQAQQGVDVRMPHSQSCWGWLLRHDATELWVAERDGVLVGMSRTLPPQEGAALAELAVSDDQAALALLGHAQARHDEPLAVQHRANTPVAVTELLATEDEPAEWYYARVERPAALLSHLGPILAARLVAAGMAERDHDVLLSTWRRHLRFRIGAAGVELLAEGGPEQAPVSKGGSGVPPDAVASLLLGAHGAAGLEARLPDCLLGRQRALLTALFPPLTADLLTFYLPT